MTLYGHGPQDDERVAAWLDVAVADDELHTRVKRYLAKQEGEQAAGASKPLGASPRTPSAADDDPLHWCEKDSPL